MENTTHLNLQIFVSLMDSKGNLLQLICLNKTVLWEEDTILNMVQSLLTRNNVPKSS